MIDPLRAFFRNLIAATTGVINPDSFSDVMMRTNKIAEGRFGGSCPALPTGWAIRLSCVANRMDVHQYSALNGVLDKWVEDPSALGDKLKAKEEILSAWKERRTSLNLQGLNLTCLPWDVLSCLTELTHLDLSHNQLSEVNLSQLEKLIHLDLSHNQLSKVDSSQLTELVYLNLSHNQLSEIDLSNLTKLLWCTLSNNLLSKINLSDLTKLIGCVLSNNKLSEVNLSQLEQLIHLDLPYNQLYKVDFSHLRRLVYLDFSGNPCDSIVDLSTLKEIIYFKPSSNARFLIGCLARRVPIGRKKKIWQGT